MPIVDVRCDEHGIQEIFASSLSRLSCPLCQKQAKRVWTAPATYRMDFRSGWDMGAGKNFYSKRDRENWISTSDSRRIRT
jgi:hypothetical protein